MGLEDTGEFQHDRGLGNMLTGRRSITSSMAEVQTRWEYGTRLLVRPRQSCVISNFRVQISEFVQVVPLENCQSLTLISVA